MSSEENEYGIKLNEFVIKQPTVISLEMQDTLKAYFGEDIGTTSTESLIRFLQEMARHTGDYWVQLDAKLNEQTPVSSSGIWLRQQATEKNLTPKDPIKAQTTIRFDKTNNLTINIPAGTVVDNGGSGDGLVEFETVADQAMPDVFMFLKGVANGQDKFNAQSGYSNIFNILDVEWVSNNSDGSSPYTSGVDYVAYISGDDEIDWSLGGIEPATGAFYYVKVIGCSINIPSQAKIAGTIGLLEVGVLNNLQGAIAGITNVINENDTQKGEDAEEDLELRGRVLSAPNVLKNDEDLDSKITNLDGINKVKIIEDIALFEVIVAFDFTPVIQAIYDSIITLIQTQKTVSSQPFAIMRILKGAANGVDAFPDPYNGIESVLWVSDKEDGSSPYTEGVDYVAYSPNDDQIDWSLGGAEPGVGIYYFVKIYQAVTIADEISLDFEGDITATSDDFTLAGLEADIGTNFRAFLRAFDIDDDIYHYDFSERVTTVEGVKRLEDFKITATVRVTKGVANGTDTLPVTETDTINWVNDEKDQGGTAYATPADYLPDELNNQIDWSPAGAEPTTGNFYFVNVTFEGDLTIAQREIAVLGNLNFALV